MLSRTFHQGTSKTGVRITLELKYHATRNEFIVCRHSRDGGSVRTNETTISEFVASADNQEREAFFQLVNVFLGE